MLSKLQQKYPESKLYTNPPSGKDPDTLWLTTKENEKFLAIPKHLLTSSSVNSWVISAKSLVFICFGTW